MEMGKEAHATPNAIAEEAQNESNLGWFSLMWVLERYSRKYILEYRNSMSHILYEVLGKKEKRPYHTG